MPTSPRDPAASLLQLPSEPLADGQFNSGRRAHDILLKAGLITHEQFLAAASEAAEKSTTTLAALIDLGFVTRKDALRASAEAVGLTFIELDDFSTDQTITDLLTSSQARRYLALPLRIVEDNAILIATTFENALNWQVRDDLRTITKRTVEFRVAMKADLTAKLNTVYRNEQEMSGLIADLLNFDDDDREDGEDSPLVRYIDLILEQAISDRASDIHIEPGEDTIRIRYRIDGVLKEMAPAPKELQAGVISRIKIMADMDIADRRLPQDGRLTFLHDSRKVDVRATSQPTVWGEKIVLRILDNSQTRMSLTELGFSEYNFKRWESAYTKAHGMLLVTGPTGSGKSTSLYATLNAINRPEVNVITVEDPVEFQMPGANQIQVNNKAGLTFASALRSILRADPDVVLIGEIRDQESAVIATQAALTGHLVLSTLHTNDSPSALTRIAEIGVEPFLIASALDCVLAQRLARRLCTFCKELFQPDPAVFDSVDFTPELRDAEFFRPRGCSRCANTGFRGRVALTEVMIVSEALQKMVVRQASSDEIAAQARLEGMHTLRQDGWVKVADGLTTIQEVLRVVA